MLAATPLLTVPHSLAPLSTPHAQGFKTKPLSWKHKDPEQAGFLSQGGGRAGESATVGLSPQANAPETETKHRDSLAEGAPARSHVTDHAEPPTRPVPQFPLYKEPPS